METLSEKIKSALLPVENKPHTDSYKCLQLNNRKGIYLKSFVIPYMGQGQGYGIYRYFQQYFNYIVAVSFISEGNRNICRKPPTNFV